MASDYPNTVMKRCANAIKNVFPEPVTEGQTSL